MPETTALQSFLKAGVAERRGFAQVASNLTRDALSKLDWDDDEFVMKTNGWRVFVDPVVEPWCVYVDVEAKRIVVHEDTYETIGETGAALAAFKADFMREDTASGMKFIVMDSGPYGDAARRRADREGTSTTGQKDLLTQLEEDANRLLIQAASMNHTPTDLQQQVFVMRLAKLQHMLGETEQRMAKLSALVALAGTAVSDALT